MPTYNDRPVGDLQTQDALNFADYVPALKSIITTGDTPLTVGIFGAWGSGKSSLMRMLRKEIEDDQKYRERTVWFTAWKYDRQDALWRTLILRVLEAMYPRQPGDGPREDRPLVEAEDGGREAQLIEKLDRLAEAVYQPVSWDEVGPRNIKWWQLISNVGGASVDVAATLASAGIWPKIKEALGGDGAPIEEIQEAAKAISKSVISQQQRQLTYMEEFEEAFAGAIKLLDDDQERAQRQARLIVFVDDLDRCLPEKAVEVLEAIKLFLEVEGAVFVLGMDQEIIRRGIEARYGERFHQLLSRGDDLPIGGDRYLQKIVQIPFHLPAMAPHDVATFIDDLGAGLSERTQESFARGLHRNPRQVKRALNIFQLLKEVAEARIARDRREVSEGLKGERELPDEAFAWPLLAKTVVIQTQYQSLYQQWRLRPTLLITLEELYERLNAPPEPVQTEEGSPEVETPGRSKNSVRDAGGDGILGRYLPDTTANLYLREMLTYPPLTDDEEGVERARFSGLRREEVERYVRLAGSVAAAPQAEEAAQVQLNLAEFLSGDEARIREAVELLESINDEKQRSAYQRQLVTVLHDENRPTPERFGAGDSLARLGDPRFREDAWFLPDEPLLGFVQMPGGPFTMGSDPQKDPAAGDDEQPQIEVDVAEFYIARYPVTVAQYQAFVSDSGHKPVDEDSLRGPQNHPVVWVTWQEAIDYGRWLTGALRLWPDTPDELRRLIAGEGWQITLPTEPQWEKAARGPEGRIYPWGDAFGPDRANTEEAEFGRTSTVGAFPGGASADGLLDLSGNVWEWIRSEYRSYGERQGQSEVAWADASDRPVLRGGSYLQNRTLSRCGARDGSDPNHRDSFLGFRLVLSPLNSDL